MKLKLKINNIKSSADKLMLKAYDTSDRDNFAFKTLNKSDYENGWEGYNNQFIEISPYFVGDLSKLYIKGNLEHYFDLNLDEEKVNKWKEYASDKADILNLNLRYTELDPEKTIKITNLNKIYNTDYSQNLVNIANSICSSGSYANKILKKIDLSLFQFIDESTGYSDFPYCYYSNTYYNIDVFYSRIVKLPNLPNKQIDSFPKNLTNVEDVSNLDTSKVTNISYAFKNNKVLKDISNLNFDSLVDGTSAFDGCNIEKLPKLVFPKIKNFDRMFYFSNEKTINIKKIDLSKSSNEFSNNFSKLFSTFDNFYIGKIIMKNTYFALPYRGNIGVVQLNPEDVEAVNKSMECTDSYGRKYCRRILPNSTTTSGGIDYYNLTGSTNVKAFPLYLIGDINTYSSTSSKNNTLWVDWTNLGEYEGLGTSYLKCIFNAPFRNSSNSSSVKRTIDSYEHTFTKEIDIPLEINPDYPYDIKIINTEYIEFSISDKKQHRGKNYETFGKNETMDINYKDGKLLITANNVKDDYYLSSSIYFTVNFKAKIDGEDFYGKTKIRYNLGIDFNLIEDINADLIFEDDSSDEQQS